MLLAYQKFCPALNANQFVPPSVVRKLNTSVLLAVVVSVGVLLAAHFTAAGHVTEKAVPLPLNSSVKLPAVPLAGVPEIVRLEILAVRLIGPNTLPFARFKVRLLPEMAGVLAVSV